MAGGDVNTFPPLERHHLSGVVEVDETYIGGKDRNRHRRDRAGKRGTFGKTAVIGAIARKGKVIAKVVQATDIATLNGFVRQTVGTGVKLVTDDHSGYHHLDEYDHESVNHSQGEYVRGLAHTQSIESFWSLLKRGIVGTFHHVSKDYLPMYLNEFSFRHNHRDDADIFERVIALA